MLAAEAGIELQFDNVAAYVKNWLGRLRDDKSLITKAAQQAQKATDRIVGRTFSDATIVETIETEAQAGVAASAFDPRGRYEVRRFSAARREMETLRSVDGRTAARIVERDNASGAAVTTATLAVRASGRVVLR